VSVADLERWEARWLAREEAPGGPEPFLVRETANLPAGTVLDVAAGDGRNALWLAAEGHAVTALDIAPAAIARLQSAATERQLEIATRAADLDAADSLAGLGPFAALVVCRFKPSAAQWATLLAALRPGGRVLLCSFRRAQHERHGFPLAYCVDRGELEALLPPRLRLLRWQEFDQPGSLMAGSWWEECGR
jgi:tellurite methyltransferase